VKSTSCKANNMLVVFNNTFIIQVFKLLKGFEIVELNCLLEINSIKSVRPALVDRDHKMRIKNEKVNP
jgi:hypothetical protein